MTSDTAARDRLGVDTGDAAVSVRSGYGAYDPFVALPAMTVVVLPGLDGTGDLLDAFCAVAPDCVECLVVRYPVDQALDYEALERLVAGQLPDDRPFVLVGESFSGPIAVRLAERAVGVVLCSSFVAPPLPRFLRYFARAMLFGLRVPDAVLAWLMLAPYATPALVAAFTSTIARVEPRVLALRVRELLSVDARAALARVTRPVLYLRGEQDRLVPERAVRRIVETLPSVRVVRIAAPHAVLQTAPKAAWEAIVAWLR